MEKILVDTDVIIDFLRGYEKRIKTVFGRIEKKEIQALLSVVSVVELYSGTDITDNNKRALLTVLLTFFEIIPLDISLSQEAGLLRQKYRLGLADSIIAASSLSLKASLFTFNTKHFRLIPNIILYTL